MRSIKEMREEGHYWTRMGDTWHVAYYGESWRGRNQWSWAGHELWYDDDVFDEIDEKRIIREETETK